VGSPSSAPHRLGEPWSREELRESVYEVVETLGDAFLIVDKDWHITFLTVYAGSRATVRAELVGQPLGTLFPDLGEGTLSRWGQYRRCMDAREPVRFLESSDELWTEVRAFPSADGGLTVFFRDVTPHMRAEAERLGLRMPEADEGDPGERKSAEFDSLKRAELEQQLIGIVSHDLRNPLQAIRLSAARPGPRLTDRSQ
jgi:signal transduction histidine kinase